VGLSSADILVSMYCRLLDRLIVEVSRDFRAAGIDHVVLKGPAIAGWLYGADEVRGYGDGDFLVPRADWERAIAVLREKGFTDSLAGMAHPRMESYHSHPWKLEGRGDIDMHATLEGIDADMDAVWRELAARRETLALEAGDVEMLAVPGRLMHVALHVAQHREGQAVLDLERALARTGDDEWREAAALAERVQALPAFISGLKALPAGEALAQRLELREVHSVQTLLRADQVPLAEGLHELSEARGLRAKLALIRGELFPSQEFMRWWSPLARRGRLGMACAYLWRPVYFATRLPAALRSLLAARRRAG
jgi:hypothetical protein